MPNGYNGKILRVDLTTKQISVEEHDEVWYRTYMGGGCMGAYYLLNEMEKGVDPLSPDNLLIMAPSIMTGAPAAGLSRHAVVTKSPLTHTFLDSQGGGWWAPELKFAGYDAIVIKGKSENPCYIWIKNGAVEIRDASHVWGKITGEAQEDIRAELGEPKARMLIIGPGGENMVKYACILNECKHANGRGGSGAVMGSKNLKAVVVKGDSKSLKFADYDKILKISKWFAENYMDNPSNKSGYYFGSADYLTHQTEWSELPTNNFALGNIKDAENLSGTTMAETILTKRERCFACPVTCKRVVKTGAPYNVDPFYGGPEYETLSALGSNCGIVDLEAVAKANELCNKYSLDTISTGVTIGFAMECYEKGLLAAEDCDGLDIRFGNKDVMLELVERIAHRKGRIGNLLADGVKILSEKIGKGSENFAIHTKGLEVALHDPRVKTGVGMGYACGAIGGDHVVVEHDNDFDEFAPDIYVEQAKPLGILRRVNSMSVGPEKVRNFCYLQDHFSLFDSLTICVLTFAPVRTFKMKHLVELLDAVTGWETSLWELMKLGERRTNLAKAFNYREGFRRKDDKLPERFYSALVKENIPIVEFPGMNKEKMLAPKIDKEEFDAAIDLMYEMMNWEEDGRPRKARLHELDVGWAVEKIY